MFLCIHVNVSALSIEIHASLSCPCSVCVHVNCEDFNCHIIRMMIGIVATCSSEAPKLSIFQDWSYLKSGIFFVLTFVGFAILNH